MKKVKLIAVLAMLFLITLFSASCSVNVVSPNDQGEIEFDILNVEITFDIDTQTVRVFNYNWNSASVGVQRYENYDELLYIMNIYACGHRPYSTVAYFDYGDDIKITVSVENITEEVFFTIGH